MIMPSIKEIILHHPYLIPLLIMALMLLGIVSIINWIARTATDGNCPGCTEHKQGPCVVACDRMSRRLDDIRRQS